MTSQIQWRQREERVASGKRPTSWGECDARADAEFVAAFREAWIKLVAEYLGCHPQKTWNTVLCGADVYEGSFRFSPALDFDLHKQLPGLNIHFSALEAITQDDYDSDEEFEMVCAREEARFVAFIQQGWLAAREAFAASFQLSKLPVRIIHSPEPNVMPLLDAVFILR